MKKIISLVAAFAMMLSASVSVFAAVDQFPEGKCEPKATFKLDQTDMGDGTYYCTLTADLSDLGTLTNVYTTNNNGIRLSAFEFYIRGDKDMNFVEEVDEEEEPVRGGGLFSAANYSMSQPYVGADATGFNFMYSNQTSTQAFPGGVSNRNTTATYLNNAVTLNFYVKAGTLTISNGKVGYMTFKASAQDTDYALSFKIPELINTSFKIGSTIVDPELTLDVVDAEKAANGYVWTATVEKGMSDITAFTLDLEDKNGDTKQKAIKDISELNKLVGPGGYSFNIGLLTDRELDSVVFTATDAAGSVDKTLNY